MKIDRVRQSHRPDGPGQVNLTVGPVPILWSLPDRAGKKYPAVTLVYFINQATYLSAIDLRLLGTVFVKYSVGSYPTIGLAIE